MSISPAKPKVIAVVGPTASGKSALAIKIAQRFNGEVVSADSRQIYRGMDIGTAKPDAAQLTAVPHHLLDIINPDEDYTVADYKRDAQKVMKDILGHGKLPVMAGGTGLYVRASLENLDIPRVSGDPELRAKLEKEIAEKGLSAVAERLIALDPEAAYIVDLKNPRRVVRALEVALLTGAPFTAQRKKAERLFDVLTVGLNPPAEILRKRIDDRVDQMIADGLVEEVTALIKKYGAKQTAFEAIGYREIVEHLSGTLSLDAAAAEIKINTWHYAKRQLTWFRKDKTVHWIENADEASALVEDFLRATGKSE